MPLTYASLCVCVCGWMSVWSLWYVNVKLMNRNECDVYSYFIFLVASLLLRGCRWHRQRHVSQPYVCVCVLLLCLNSGWVWGRATRTFICLAWLRVCHFITKTVALCAAWPLPHGTCSACHLPSLPLRHTPTLFTYAATVMATFVCRPFICLLALFGFCCCCSVLCSAWNCLLFSVNWSCCHHIFLLFSHTHTLACSSKRFVCAYFILFFFLLLLPPSTFPCFCNFN